MYTFEENNVRPNVSSFISPLMNAVLTTAGDLCPMFFIFYTINNIKILESITAQTSGENIEMEYCALKC